MYIYIYIYIHLYEYIIHIIVGCATTDGLQEDFTLRVEAQSLGPAAVLGFATVLLFATVLSGRDSRVLVVQLNHGHNIYNVYNLIYIYIYIRNM